MSYLVVPEELDVKRVFTVELKSLCDGDTYELTVCHWQPDITLARQEILPEAMEILDLSQTLWSQPG